MSENRKNREPRIRKPIRPVEGTEKPSENERKPAEDVRKPVEGVQQSVESTQEQLQKASLMSSMFLQRSIGVCLLSPEGKKAAFECMNLTLQAITGLADVRVAEIRPDISKLCFAGKSVDLGVVALDNLGRRYILRAENAIERANPSMMSQVCDMVNAAGTFQGEDEADFGVFSIVITPEKVSGCNYVDGIAGIEEMYQNVFTGELYKEPYNRYRWACTGYAVEESGNPLLADIMHDFTVSEPEDCRLDCFRQLLRYGKG